MATQKNRTGAATTPRSVWNVAAAEISGALRDRVLLGAGVAVAAVLLLGRLLPLWLGGSATAGALSLLVALFFGSLMIVPLLLEEEREQRLRGAPAASPGVALAGKGLAGLALGLAGMAVALLIYATLVTRWDAAVLAGALTVLFGLSVGLLIDLLVEARRLALWLVGIGLALLLPALLLAPPESTGLAEQLLRWSPTVALLRLFETGLGAATAALAPAALAVALPTAALLVVAGWLVRRAG